MRYQRVKIRRDTQTVHNVLVPPWEVPVLEFIFEDGNVERTEESEEVSADYPDPRAEFDRLVRAYGADSKNEIPHVVSVYGDSARGLRELKRAIEEAKAADKKPGKRGRKAKAADPLLD